MSGTAKLSAGEGIWILVQGTSPSVYYLEGQVRPWADKTAVDTGWDFRATVGGATVQSDEQFTIVAVVLDPVMTSYLEGMMGAGKSADASLPPGITSSDKVDVQRTPGTYVGTCR